MTVTYRASGLDLNTTLEAAGLLPLRQGRQPAAGIRLPRRRGSGRADEPGGIERTHGADGEFGKASLLLETRFDQSACERLFRQPVRLPIGRSTKPSEDALC